jgi:hypothetical protein
MYSLTPPNANTTGSVGSMMNPTIDVLKQMYPTKDIASYLLSRNNTINNDTLWVRNRDFLTIKMTTRYSINY